jgi:hypothetical protein
VSVINPLGDSRPLCRDIASTVDSVNKIQCRQTEKIIRREKASKVGINWHNQLRNKKSDKIYRPIVQEVFCVEIRLLEKRNSSRGFEGSVNLPVERVKG